MKNTQTMNKLEVMIIGMPEIQAGKDLWQNAFHEFDVYGHTLDYVKHLKQMTDDPEIIVAGYLHDIGKPVVAKPKIKDGVVQEREPGKIYHEFKDHEVIGEKMVYEMDPTLFTDFKLNQNRIAKLVGSHYLPMKGIKSMRKAKTFEEFESIYKQLEVTLDNSGCSRQEVLMMFLADKLAQGRFCTDKEELFSIRESLLGSPTYTPKQIYKMQKEIYGGSKE